MVEASMIVNCKKIFTTSSPSPPSYPPYLFIILIIILDPNNLPNRPSKPNYRTSVARITLYTKIQPILMPTNMNLQMKTYISYPLSMRN